MQTDSFDDMFDKNADQWGADRFCAAAMAHNVQDLEGAPFGDQASIICYISAARVRTH